MVHFFSSLFQYWYACMFIDRVIGCFNCLPHRNPSLKWIQCKWLGTKFPVLVLCQSETSVVCISQIKWFSSRITLKSSFFSFSLKQLNLVIRHKMTQLFFLLTVSLLSCPCLAFFLEAWFNFFKMQWHRYFKVHL